MDVQLSDSKLHRNGERQEFAASGEAWFNLTPDFAKTMESSCPSTVAGKWLASEGQFAKKNRSRYCGEEGSGRFLRTGFSPEAGAGRVAAGVADGLGESARIPPDPSV